jgi:RNA polymerase sigma factor (sigma-70 family)
MEGVPVVLEQLITSQYKLALYEACRQTADLDHRRRAYSDLFCYLYRAAYNRWPDIAEDVAHRALILTCDKLGDCESPIAILTFAMWQTRRAATEIFRTRKKEVSLDEIADSGVDFAQPVVDSPRFDQDCLRLLLEMLLQLSERQRQVIALKYVDGLSDAIISERTGLSITNVRVLRNRGLKRLRQNQRLRDTCADI